MPGVELSWEQIEVTQNAANKKAGPRFVPGRRIPVPSTVSSALQKGWEPASGLPEKPEHE